MAKFGSGVAARRARKAAGAAPFGERIPVVEAVGEEQ
jgi:hypothetical protein